MLSRFITLLVVNSDDRHVFKLKSTLMLNMQERKRNRLSDSLALRISITDREALEEIAYNQRKPASEVARGYILDGSRREIGA